MLFKYPLVSQHNLQKLNRKLAASVKTPSMKVVPASLPTSKKNPDQAENQAENQVGSSWGLIAIPKALCTTELSSRQQRRDKISR